MKDEIADAFGEMMDSFCKFAFFPKMIMLFLNELAGGTVAVEDAVVSPVDRQKYIERIPDFLKPLASVGNRMAKIARLRSRAIKRNDGKEIDLDKINAARKKMRCEFWDILRELRFNVDTMLKFIDNADKRIYKPFMALNLKITCELRKSPSSKRSGDLDKMQKGIADIVRFSGMEAKEFEEEFDALLTNAKSLQAALGYSEPCYYMSASELFNDTADVVKQKGETK